MGAAVIPETMMVSDLLKPTGYDCPEDLIGKTFTEAMASETLNIQDTKEVTVSANGAVTVEPDDGYDAIKKVIITVEVE